MPFHRLVLAAVVAGLSCLTLPARAAHAPHSEPTVTVGILLFDGVEIIDFSAPYEVFGQAGFGVYTVSADGKPVITAMGLKVTPDHAFADAPAADVLLVPGGDVDDASRDAATLDFIRQRTGRARHVLSVCTGAQILAATGLLDGLRATTFHRALDALEHHYPKVDVVRDVRWADNGKLITSAGLSSGTDAALHVVAKLHGEDVARSTALQLEYDWAPEGGFVRTALADRYMPNLAKASWPEDANFHQLLSLGDERQWRSRYRTTTRTSPDDLLALVDAAVAQEAGWSPAEPAQPHHWQSTRDGRQIDLQFLTQDADGAAGNGYVLEARLQVR